MHHINIKAKLQQLGKKRLILFAVLLLLLLSCVISGFVLWRDYLQPTYRATQLDHQIDALAQIEQLEVTYIGDPADEEQKSDPKNYIVTALYNNGDKKQLTDFEFNREGSFVTVRSDSVSKTLSFEDMDAGNGTIFVDPLPDDPTNGEGDITVSAISSDKTASSSEVASSQPESSTESSKPTSSETSSEESSGGNGGSTNRPTERVLVKELLLITPPDKTTYLQGNLFDTSGLVIEVVFTDGSKKRLENIVIEDTKLMPGTTSVAIGYTGSYNTMYCYIPVSVTPRTPTALTITAPPNKVNYVEGMLFVPEGMAVNIAFDNGDTESAGYQFPTNELTAGQTEIILSYTEHDKTVTAVQSISVVKRTPVSMRIDTPPEKVRYIEEMHFTTAAMTLSVKYDNGKTHPVTNYSYDNAQLTFGVEQMELSYEENGKTVTANQPITVDKRTPISMKIDKPPLKVRYIEETHFATQSMAVSVKFDNGNTHPVSNYSYDSAELMYGVEQMELSYEENGETVKAAQPISVVKRTPTKLNIVTNPKKVAYIEDMAFVPDGLTLSVDYDNGKSYPITTFDYSKVDFLFGETEKEISYEENGKTVTANIPVTVARKTPVSLSVKQPPTKVQYIEETPFDAAGIKVEGFYDNGKTYPVTGYTYSHDELTFGTNKVTLSYEENSKPVSVDQSITVVKKTPVSLTIKQPPTQTSYIEEIPFNSSGMVVECWYDNGKIHPVTNYSYDKAELTVDRNEVELSYEENGETVKAVQPISVVKRTPTKLNIVTQPDKTAYIEDMAFIPDGLTLSVDYDNGKNYPVSTFDYSKVDFLFGETAKEISYEENGKKVTANVSVTVAKKTPMSLSIKQPPAKVQYIEETPFDAAGMKVEGLYDNEKTYSVTGYSYSHDELTFGTDKVTLSYEENGKPVSVDQSITVVKKTPVSLSVKQLPAKTTYLEETVFDKAGMVVECLYDNDKRYAVTGYSYPTGELQLSDTYALLSYTENGKPVNLRLPIQVINRTPTKLNIVTNPKKTAYIEDMAFAPDGLTLSVEYDNGKTHPASTFDYDKVDFSFGQTKKVVSYEENGTTVTTNVPVTVAKKTPKSMTVTQPPTKTRYIEDTPFENAGMQVQGLYDNNKTYPVTSYSFSHDDLAFGADSVALSYKENGATVETNQAVTVVKKTPVSLSVKQPPTKTRYVEETKFDTAGMKVEGLYDNGKTYPVNGYSYSRDALTFGTSKITLTYEENGKPLTADQPITVVKKSPTKLNIVTAPKKVSYLEGTAFVPDGLSLSAEYDNGKTYPVSTFDYAKVDFKLGQTGKEVTYTENGKQVKANVPVTVNRKTPQVLMVTQPPTKTQYIEETTFDKTGMVINVSYDNGKTYTVTDYTLPAGELAFGTATVQIAYTYNNVTIAGTTPVTVVKKTPTALRITAPPVKTSYIEGNLFDKTGMTVVADYDNGKTYPVPGFTVPDDALIKGQIEVPVRYIENGVKVAAEQPITVAAKSPVSIAITRAPNRTAYFAGQVFDPTGMVVTATYNNGDVAAVTGYTWDRVRLYEGQTSIEIRYSEASGAVTTRLGMSTGAQQAVYRRYAVSQKANGYNYVVGATVYYSGVNYRPGHICNAPKEGDQTVPNWYAYEQLEWRDGVYTLSGNRNAIANLVAPSRPPSGEYQNIFYFFADNGTVTPTCYKVYDGAGGCYQYPTTTHHSTSVYQCSYTPILEETIGGYIDNVSVTAHSLPANGKHTDGYWYVFDHLVEDALYGVRAAELPVFPEEDVDSATAQAISIEKDNALLSAYDLKSNVAVLTAKAGGVSAQVNISVGAQQAVYRRYTATGGELIVDIPFNTMRNAYDPGYSCSKGGSSAWGDPSVKTNYYYTGYTYANGLFNTSGGMARPVDNIGGYLYLPAVNSPTLTAIQGSRSTTSCRADGYHSWTEYNYYDVLCSYAPIYQGDYIDNVTVAANSLPANGRHTDGYWYMLDHLIEE